HRYERHSQCFDRAIHEMLLEEVHEAFALEHAPVQTEVHERHNIAQAQRANPALETFEFSCSIGGPHQSTDRRAAHNVGFDSRFFQCLDYPDMRPTSS